MARTTYTRGHLGAEVQAPWGYYQTADEGSLEYAGRQVLYTLGSACVEASCCGKGSWNYARVEGYLLGDPEPGAAGVVEVDTIEDAADRVAIAGLVLDKHPGVRMEFR